MLRGDIKQNKAQWWVCIWFWSTQLTNEDGSLFCLDPGLRITSIIIDINESVNADIDLKDACACQTTRTHMRKVLDLHSNIAHPAHEN